MDSINTLPLIVGLSVIATIVAVILLYIKVLPENKRASLPPIGKFAADFFSFKELYLEKVMRFFYILGTVSCIVTGALMLYGFEHSEYTSYYGYTRSNTTWYGGYGIALAIVGPIVLRLAYEGVMMFILLVKNTIEINNKMKSDKAEAPAQENAPLE